MKKYDLITGIVTGHCTATLARDTDPDEFFQDNPDIDEYSETVSLADIDDREGLIDEICNLLSGDVWDGVGGIETATIEAYGLDINIDVDIGSVGNPFTLPDASCAEDNSLYCPAALDNPEDLRNLVEEMIDGGEFTAEIKIRDYGGYLDRYIDTLSSTYESVFGFRTKVGPISSENVQISDDGRAIKVYRDKETVIRGEGAELLNRVAKTGYSRFADELNRAFIANNLISPGEYKRRTEEIER